MSRIARQRGRIRRADPRFRLWVQALRVVLNLFTRSNTLAVYHIGRCILGTDERFDDGSHMIYVNGACRDESPIGLLMHDFFCTDADEMHYPVLAERMRYFKGTGKGADNMTLLSDELREEGRAEERKTTALFLLAAGKYALEEISAISRLPIEEIRKLQAAQGG